MLKDYSHILVLLQKRMAQEFERDQELFNVPGKSIACKIDPHYYLVVYPGFIHRLARLCGYLPSTIEETLLRTGNLIINPKTGKFVIALEVRWKDDMPPIRVNCAFVRNSFIDNALRFYSSIKREMPISSLKIGSSFKGILTSFFEKKTPLHAGVFF